MLAARNTMVTNISPCLQETHNFKENLGKKTNKEAINCHCNMLKENYRKNLLKSAYGEKSKQNFKSL